MKHSHIPTQDISTHSIRVHTIAELAIQWSIQTSSARVQEEGWARIIVESIGTGENPEEVLYARAEEKVEEVSMGIRRMIEILAPTEEEEEGKEADDEKDQE